jgi:Fe-S cluster assembly protein SufD
MDTPLVRYVTESSNLTYHVKKDGIWRGYFIVTGEKSMDISISLILGGKHTHASIGIVNYLSGNASVRLKTVQHHKTGNSQSNILVKTVVSDKSSFVFDGSIVIDRNADKTDAYERNENLILSGDSRIVTRPTLEILSSDVRCTHAAATGEIPFDKLWYLKTRGLSDKEAETVYVEGFIRSVFADCKQDMTERIMHRIMDI